LSRFTLNGAGLELTGQAQCLPIGTGGVRSRDKCGIQLKCQFVDQSLQDDVVAIADVLRCRA
jgi:hypothetical protein